MSELKKCYKCKEFLPTTAFGPNRAKKDGLHDNCRECKNKWGRERYHRDKEKNREKRHNYYLTHRERIIRKSCEFALNNKEYKRIAARKAKNKLKTQVMVHYGNGEAKCQCGVNELALLTIDHIAGGGNQHRKEIGLKGAGYGFYRWLKKNGFPPGYQVLCWNCQYRKRRKEMAPANPNERQQKQMDYVQSIKTECLNAYGQTCPCGETDKVVLTLDHVNNDGGKHRRELGKSGFNFYVHLRNAGFPVDPPLAVLCLNCQYRKRLQAEDELERLNRSAIDNGCVVGDNAAVSQEPML